MDFWAFPAFFAAFPEVLGAIVQQFLDKATMVEMLQALIMVEVEEEKVVQEEMRVQMVEQVVLAQITLHILELLLEMVVGFPGTDFVLWEIFGKRRSFSEGSIEVIGDSNKINFNIRTIY